MLPTLFFGHGNPMNAVEENEFTKGWRSVRQTLARPKAILCISAHWYVPGTRITAMPRPRTIHDFGGFPRSLYEVSYPAPGDPALASEIQSLLAPTSVDLDYNWGLDHGTWSVLIHLFPDADVPVLQLSIDETKPASFHYELGKKLLSLRDRGILVVGSGNLVHNLHAYSWGRHPVEPMDWALRFEQKARALLEAGDHNALIQYEKLGHDARLAIPTPDHYLPLLYVLALQQHGEEIRYPVEGFDGGSVSMLTIQIG